MGLHMDFYPSSSFSFSSFSISFSFFSSTPLTFGCKDNIYVFILGAEKLGGGGGVIVL